jgi:AMMECR1 domain-containing protein
MKIDYLTVSYDDSDKDFPVIVVLRSGKSTTSMLRGCIGNEARDLYRILTDQSVKFKIVEGKDEE